MVKKDIVKVIRPGRGGSRIPPRTAGIAAPPPRPRKPTIPAAGIMGPRPPKR